MICVRAAQRRSPMLPCQVKGPELARDDTVSRLHQSRVYHLLIDAPEAVAWAGAPR
jgi:hypothetical protein